MKYIVILGDGMADRPIKELNNRTPLEAAETPMMDYLASRGVIGMTATIPEGMKPGSDTANLAVLGYNPEKYYSGRSPLEALSIGVPMKENDVALRVNLITVSEEDFSKEDFGKRTITDHSSDEISTEEADILLKAVVSEFKKTGKFSEYKFYTGTGYRHCCIWENGKVFELAQPHDHLGSKAEKYLPDFFVKENAPDAEDEKILKAAKDFTEIEKLSFEILNHHPVNEKRRSEGKNAANALWFWGAGTKPSLTSFEEKTGKKGAIISAVDLLKGIGYGAKMTVPDVEGASGRLETNYEGKAKKAVEVLTKEGCDFVYVHVEAPDEMGHQGSIERKIKAIEYLDKRLIRNIYNSMKEKNIPFRMLIMPDHPTPIELRTHSNEPVPFIIYDSTKEIKTGCRYSEKEARLTGSVVEHGYRIIEKLFEA